MKENEQLKYEENLEFKEFQEKLLHERKKEQKLMQLENEMLLQDMAKLEQQVGQLREALESSRRKTKNQNRIIDNMADEIDNQENQVTNLRSYGNHLQLIVALQEREFWALLDEFRRFIDGLRFRQQFGEEQVTVTALRADCVSYEHVPD